LCGIAQNIKIESSFGFNFFLLFKEPGISLVSGQ